MDFEKQEVVIRNLQGRNNMIIYLHSKVTSVTVENMYVGEKDVRS